MLIKSTGKYSSSHRTLATLSLLPLVLALASCNNLKTDTSVQAKPKSSNLAELKPLRDPKPEEELVRFTAEAPDYKTNFQPGPGVSITNTVAAGQAKELNLNLTGAPVTANYHDMPLPIFINEVFGNQLGLSFNLDPQIQKQTDLVTMREAAPVAPSALFRDAVHALAAYGVAVTQQDNVLSFTIDKNATSGEVPLLISGRTLPDVPESHRPVFMFVPLKVVTNSKVASWVRSAMTGKEVSIEEDPTRNAVLLKGKPDLVQQALGIIDVLDQPLMRGKFSTSIEPAFVKASDLSKNLKEVLNAEGYDATIKSSTGSIMLIPLDGTNQIVVFAGSQAILEHVRDWVKTLDRRQQMSIDQGIFTYEVRNAEAGHIVELLNGIENGSSSGAPASPSRSQSAVASGSAVSDSVNTASVASQGATAKLAGGNFAVDTNRNTIVFKGSGQAWADLLPVIQSLDKPAPSVLIEVLLAEVKLDGSENSGIDFVSNSTVTANGTSYNSKIQTTTIGTSGSALLATLDNAGSVRAKLNLYQKKSRIDVRSRPRLMVKSGQTASIDVGNEVAVATGSIQSTTTTDSPIRTAFNYRKTGVTLTVKPTVHASGNVDIDIDQALSEVGEGGGDSPPIFNRQIKTMVTLQDGGSILLAGLISDSKTRGKVGVPWLSSIPLLGKAFRTDTMSSARTELLVMIIPYVIENPAEGEAITKTIQESFQHSE